jgi:hypothetical protein
VAAGPKERAARWIGNPDGEQAVAAGRSGAAALPVFEADFPLDRPVLTAALRLTALGVYEARVNGHAVGAAV